MDFNIEKILSESKGRPSGMLLINDPNTGEPMLAIPESKKEEKAMKKALSPTGKDEPMTGPKILAPPQEPVSKQMLADDSFGFDKEKIKELIGQEQSGIAQLEQSIQGLKREPQSINWKPAAAFLDAGVKGQNLAAAMPEYTSPEDRAFKIAQLENLVQQRKSGATENALSLLKNSLAKQQLGDERRREHFEKAQGLKKEDTIRKDFSGLMGKVEEDQQMLSTIAENLGRGDYQSVMTSLAHFARSVGGEKGVLNIDDIKRVMPHTFTGDLAKALAYMGSPDVEITPRVVENMKELTEIARQRTMEKHRKALQLKKSTYQNPKSSYYELAAPGSGGVGDVLVRDSEERINALIAPPSKGGGVSQGLPSFDEYKKMKKGK